jgi:hypothetical protein
VALDGDVVAWDGRRWSPVGEEFAISYGPAPQASDTPLALALDDQDRPIASRDTCPRRQSPLAVAGVWLRVVHVMGVLLLMTGGRRAGRSRDSVLQEFVIKE